MAPLASACGLVAMMPTPARAAVKNETLVASGALTYTWQGDPARGCAALSLCDVRGEATMRPQGGGQLLSLTGGGPNEILIDATGAVRVLRGGPTPGECVDLPDQTFNPIDVRLLSHGRTTAVLQAPAGSGRCAGPLQSDLAGIAIPIKRTGGSRPSFDLSGTRSFVAGPFSGTLVSTLELKPEPSNAAGGFSSSSSSSGGGHATPVTVESAQLTYRVSAVSTSIQTLFNGAGDSSCQILDSCGASGSLTLSVHPKTTFTVFAERIVHGHPGRARVLSDLRRGRLNLNGFANLTGDVSESYAWSDGSSCQDSAPTPVLILALGAPGSSPSGARSTVTLNSNTGPGVETFRTHCPGPAAADLIGENGVLAGGALTPSELLSRHVSLALTEPPSFSGLGYTGSRQGSIRLDLTLTKLSVSGGR